MSAASTTAPDGPRLQIRDLDVHFATDGGDVHAVDGVSLEVAPGEILAIVGESGSGKSVTARSVLGLLPETAEAAGAVIVSGTDLVGLSGARLRALRGEDVAMIFQEPSSALNPVFPIWWQLGEGLRAHRPKITRRQIRDEAVTALESVGIPDAAAVIDRYPHEFSGGQKQRIMIAMALALGAELIVADEPTTALDVTVQAEILDLLRDVRDRFGTSIIVITHNMGVVADLADSVAVMHRGRIIERAGVQELFAEPREEYTRTLLAAVPHLGRDSAWTALTPQRQQEIEEAEPLVVAEDLVIEYPGRWGKPPFRAVKGVDFRIRAGEVYGLVGESGSGKTTIGRAIAGLERTTGGSLTVLGHQMHGMKEKEFKPLRRRIGFVFQDPATSFNPHLTIEQCIAEPLIVHEASMTAAQRGQTVRELLEAVELPGAYARRYPHELSGGQRQRISLARALVLEPELLIADEPTSALDVSVQATVLELFRELQQRLGFAALFISHDLAVVDSLAHRIGVLFRGDLVEDGHGPDVLQRPAHEYTRRLIASLPVPDPAEQAARREEYIREWGRGREG
ncbi:ABC transporter ATP-binding protein [Brachybacterium saurashtrense]|uniref:ABC transporter ATP-binding protein n=1 Tax=Brachybacterium saurashtrense TaxID=556288 RepID=A0A345YMX4_9MICO|nr:ABC transporter ATP-binding protein [Brachybacterium saurashtrense]AXK45276.1 ABC transporter ATP-binding protein [Brachybacterium saurashtrense]RRR21968.1 ABC transporter ATP-binding protein [Brachybacterium saurashtrense]